MRATKTDDSSLIKKAGRTLHLVAPSSQGKPLCGETSPDAAIGAYCEHLDEHNDWCREIFGTNGKRGKPCEHCLALYPSLLWGRPHRLSDSIDLQAVIRIAPYPQSIREEFAIKGFCISDDFVIDSEPVVTGQRVIHGKVALTVLTRIVPKAIGSAKRKGR